jgi:hypothetical protein
MRFLRLSEWADAVSFSLFVLFTVGTRFDSPTFSCFAKSSSTAKKAFSSEGRRALKIFFALKISGDTSVTLDVSKGTL